MDGVVVPVVLAGGRGTRLWPMSRSSYPKQFLRLAGRSTLFQDTLGRVAVDPLQLPPLVVTNDEYRFLVLEQAREAGMELSGVLLEPVQRNTAMAIAAAAVHARDRFGSGVVLHVLPSDHMFVPGNGYAQSLRAGVSAAQAGYLVTFGVTPTAVRTGYGHIEPGDPISDGVRHVLRFVEKPPEEQAKAMVESGNFLWNSGIFMVSADAFLEECRCCVPDTFESARKSVASATVDLGFLRLDREAFLSAPDISVDHAVFEKTRRAAVVPVDDAWSDMGCWDAVWGAGDKDGSGNLAQGRATFRNATNCLVVGEKAHVAVDGLDDIAVIATEDAVYVGKLSETQHIGGMVAMLHRSPDTTGLTESHPTCYRPWGGYASVLAGDRFQVKRLFVHPGKQLSLQRHHHRSEHWIVVKGTAEVTLDGTVTVLSENQSVYLPLGSVHRLANPGKILLELIEVQTGSYLGEDDIIRIEDDFGRV